VEWWSSISRGPLLKKQKCVTLDVGEMGTASYVGQMSCVAEWGLDVAVALIYLET